MQQTTTNRLTSDEWTTVRDFTVGEHGQQFPRYEAKFVSNVDAEYVENELVLVRETDVITGSEQIYQLPKGVFEGVIEQFQ
ncbi:hypothetical protein ACLI4U_11460 [Natrialbaceae archaeon A-CW2]|uniref:hypothetical protein n=1 Tax=Natronosalvus amylolyticus TaxID=2961994 RepID=UPI0020C9D2C9|nr:hypothetical protein [Natronosalvus amylolyticus]